MNDILHVRIEEPWPWLRSIREKYEKVGLVDSFDEKISERYG